MKLNDLIKRIDINKDKLNEYLETNPEQRKFNEAVIDNRVETGMSLELCLLSWGTPLSVHVSQNIKYDLKTLKYCFSPDYMISDRASLIFEEGILITINNKYPQGKGFDYTISNEDVLSKQSLQYQYVHDLSLIKNLSNNANS